MKRILLGLFISILFLTACGRYTPQTPPTADSVIDASAPSSTPFPTRISLPSATPTITVTPLPTIPTFTPTFDVSTIVTVTPAPKAECPKTTSIKNPNLDFLDSSSGLPRYPKATENNFLDFLNKYDSMLLVKFIQNEWGDSAKRAIIQDFTNDKVPELALGVEVFYIFGCKNGHYETLLELPPNQYSTPAFIVSIEDNNHNGISEITFLTDIDTHGGKYYQVFEWNGSNFANLIPSKYPDFPESGEIRINNSGNLRFGDVTGDTIKELIVDSGIPIWDVYYDGFPWRNERTYYKWNGQNYSKYKIEFHQPEFRFQAVQDADLAISQQEYDKALSLYRDAIFNGGLKSYSPEIRDNLRAQWDASFGEAPTPTPYPVAKDEYPKLASYAYYRIMLLHLVQNQESEANTTYSTLQQEFGNDPYGNPYVEMASAFWDAYQSTHKMHDGCAAAIQYAVEHPEILTPLGSDYHGWQSHMYVPDDICPFR